MKQDLQSIIHLIQQSPLDDTIKEILIRDLKSEGLTDFMREQIKAYCLEGVIEIDEQIAKAKKVLEDKSQQNPA